MKIRILSLLCFLAAGVFLFFWRRTPSESVYETAECGPVKTRPALLVCALILVALSLWAFWLSLQ